MNHVNVISTKFCTCLMQITYCSYYSSMGSYFSSKLDCICNLKVKNAVSVKSNMWKPRRNRCGCHDCFLILLVVCHVMVGWIPSGAMISVTDHIVSQLLTIDVRVHFITFWRTAVCLFACLAENGSTLFKKLGLGRKRMPFQDRRCLKWLEKCLDK